MVERVERIEEKYIECPSLEPWRKLLLEKSRRKQEDNTKIILREIGWEYVD
jgi:hypothetical protein